MSTLELIEIKHFDKDGDGSLSVEEQLDKDLTLLSVREVIDGGTGEGAFPQELLEDVFVAQLMDHNVARQRERISKGSSKTPGRRNMFA